MSEVEQLRAAVEKLAQAIEMLASGAGADGMAYQLAREVQAEIGGDDGEV